jgi:DivIVA domain-containing protein
MSPEPPLDATGIARRHFSTVRRGYEPADVRAFLHDVADMVGRLQRAEAHERERAERAETRAVLAEQLDEHRLVELLGEETARVLDSARAAADDIRTKAQESAARMVREAQVQAHGVAEQAERDAAARKVEILAEADVLRREAEVEVERRRAEGLSLFEEMRHEAEAERDRMLSEGERARAQAEADADAIRAAAREEGSALVADAQAVRERVLGELARRRRSAREQLERLSAARDRLLTAYDVVRRTVDEATSELTVVLPEAKAAGDLAMQRIHDLPEPTAEELEAELAVARMTGLVGGGGARGPVGEGDELAAGEDHGVPVLGEMPVGSGGQAPEGGEAGAPDADETAGAGNGDAGEPVADRSATGAAAERDAAAPSAEAPVAGTGSDTYTDDAAPPVAATLPLEHTEGDDAGAGSQGTGERWGVWPFRRRPSSGGDDKATGRGAGTDDDLAELNGGDHPGSAPVDEQVAGGGDDEGRPAAVDEQRGAGAEEDDASHHGAGGGTADVSGPAGDDPGEPDAERELPDRSGRVDQLFARIKAERRGSAAGADETAEGAVGSGGSTGGVAVALADETTPGPDDTAPEDAADAATPGADAEADADTHGAPAPAGTVDDPNVARLLARDVALADPERELSRQLKRVLADEQNEVFDLLRRAKPSGAADVLPAPAEHVARYARAGLDELDVAARAGAESVGGRVRGSSTRLAREMGEAVVEPMRQRIDRSFDECGGDVEEVTERLRSLYREWKGQRISSVVRHYTAAAFARGAYDASPRGADLVWLVDRTGEPCPDADDNALAGRVRKGQRFPTGHRCAPAHPDCRCLVVPAD